MKHNDVHKIKVNMALIESEITSFLAAITNENHDMESDDQFKQDILEGSTDFLDIMDRLIVNLHITNEYILGAKAARARIDDRITRHQAKSELVRRLMKRLMEVASIRKVVAPTGTVSIGNKAPSVEILDADLLPDEFVRIKREPNKTLIGEKLKAGEDVSGAILTNGGETLIVR